MQTLGSLILLVGLLSAAREAAATEVISCANIAVEGASCERLAVNIDVRGCGDPVTAAAKLHCSGTTAEAVLTTKKARYRVALAGESIWGTIKWTPTAVSRTVLAEHGARPKTSAVKNSTAAPPPVASVTPAAASSPDLASKTSLAANPPVPLALSAKPMTAAPSQRPLPPPPVPPTPSPTPGPNLAFAGFFDFYYSFNSTKPAPATSPASSAGGNQAGLPQSQTPLRNFDQFHNQLGLNLAELSVKRSAGDASVQVDFDFGEQADTVARQSDGRVDDVSKNIGQAIITYTPSAVPILTLQVGKMATNIGWETMKSKDNWNESRSFLFALAVPYWHVGADASAAVIPNELTVSAYVYNGWNTLYAPNDGKTIGMQVVYKITPTVTLTYNGLGGPEQTDDDRDRKIVHEASAVWTTAALAVATDVVHGTSAHDLLGNGTVGNATWSAWEVAAKVPLTPDLFLSPRLERYWDPQGYTSGVAQTLQEDTLTLGYTLTDGLETRLESRRDLFSHSQTTATWAILYAF